MKETRIDYLKFIALIMALLGVAVCANIFSKYYGAEYKIIDSIAFTLGSVAGGIISVYIAIYFKESEFRKIREIADRSKQLRTKKDLWGEMLKKDGRIHIVHGGSGLKFSIDGNAQTSIATMYCTHYLTKYFKRLTNEENSIVRYSFNEFKCVRKKDIEAALARGLILLNGVVSMKSPNFTKEVSKLALRQAPDSNGTYQIVNERGLPAIADQTLHNESGVIIRDVALFTIIHEEHGGLLYWISGNYGEGTFAATLLAIYSKYKSENIRPPERGHYVQGIVEIKDIVDGDFDENHNSIKMCYIKDSTVIPEGFKLMNLFE